MTKKRSLLLTGLFAVSSILPCHAKLTFDDIGSWDNHPTLFNRLGLPVTYTKGSRWHESVLRNYKNDYKPVVDEFKKLVPQFNAAASAIEHQIVNLPVDGTQLFKIWSKAKEIGRRVLYGQEPRAIEQDIVEISRLHETLIKKLELAKKYDIQISHLFGSNNQPSNKTQSQNQSPAVKKYSSADPSSRSGNESRSNKKRGSKMKY